MDISPKTLREVEFREKFRGYHPEDVDAFLERAAVGVEALQNQLRQATERAAHAEQLASATGTTDEALSRTLLLAQRTADMAVEEAREQAARLVAAAESQAKIIIDEANTRAARTTEEAQAELRAQLADLERVRQQLQDDVEVLQQWVEQHRSSLSMSLGNLLRQLEADLVVQSAPPAISAVEIPGIGGDAADDSDDDDLGDELGEGSGIDDDFDDELDAELDDEEELDDDVDDDAELVDEDGEYGDDDELDDELDDDVDDELAEAVGGGVNTLDDDESALPEDQGAMGAVEGELLDEPLEGDVDTSAGDDDPFMAELRRAVTDTEPLGPRDEDAGPPQDLPHASLQEDLDAKRFGSRIRRRR